MFQEEGKIPKAMVKYASGISLESIGAYARRTIQWISIIIILDSALFIVYDSMKKNDMYM
jgi:hypothetical protein